MRKQRGNEPIITAWALSVMLALGNVPESTAADPPSTTFEDTSRVVLIQVPVNIVARDGEPMRGLTAADFTLLDEGEPQKIAHLETIDLAASHPDRLSLERELDRLPAVARRHFLLLFDLSFSTPTSIIRAREAAHKFVLQSLHPTDLAAVATFSLDYGPRLLVTFTPDRAQLSRGIATLGIPELLARGRVADPLRFVISDPVFSSSSLSLEDSLSFSGSSGGPPSTQALYDAFAAVVAKQADRAQKAYERQRINAWSRSMGDMAQALASVPGRKHVIYFSEGFDGRLLLGREPNPSDIETQRDQRSIEEGMIWMVDNDDRFGNSGLMKDVNEMLETFRRADAVIQAVDIGGLRAEGSPATQASESALAVANVGQDALFYVAHETGGELFEDANELSGQLSDLLQRTTVTYVLSFYPTALKFDGAYHRLKVKAELPRGARMSHRPGYFAPRSFKDLHPLEKALIASEAIASGAPRQDLKIQVLAAPFRAAENVAYVPVIIEVDGASLLAESSENTVGVEFYTYATNRRGEMQDFFSQTVQLDLRQVRKTIAAGGLKYYGHLELKPDDYLVRVLVRNAQTGRVGVESIRVAIPPYTEMQPALLPPFFVEEPGRWLLIREKLDESQSASVVYPFTVKGEPYIPSARPALGRNQASQVCLVAYNMGDGEIELRGTVVGPDGSPLVGGQLALVERTVTGIVGVDKLLASFNPKGIKEGEYTLQVQLTNRATGTSQSNSIPFVVN